MIQHKFSSEDFTERVELHEQQMEYLYEDGDYHFMNTETYEQISMAKDELGEQVNYLVPNTTIKVLFHEGNPFSLNLPASVDLAIVETAPSIKGATVTNVTKPATTETGSSSRCPLSSRKARRFASAPSTAATKAAHSKLRRDLLVACDLVRHLRWSESRRSFRTLRYALVAVSRRYYRCTRRGPARRSKLRPCLFVGEFKEPIFNEMD